MGIMNTNNIIEYQKLNQNSSSQSPFSTKNPRDIINGASHGLTNLAKGVVGGIAGLFVLPYMCIKSEGQSGILKGIGLGLTSLVSLPIIGFLTGSYQIVRGILN